MKDFKRKDLYDAEQGKFKYAIENRIETNTEYNTTTKYSTGLEEEEEDMNYLTSGFEDMDSSFSLGDIDSGFGDFGNFGMSSGGIDESWKQGKPIYEQFLYSLVYLCKIVFQQMSDGKNTKEEWKTVMKPLQILGFGLFIVSLLAKFVGLNTPHIPMLGIFVGLTVLSAGVIIDYQIYKSGPIARFKGVTSEDTENIEGSESLEDDPFDLGDFDSEGELNFFDTGEDSFGSADMSFNEDSMTDDISEEVYEDDSDFYEDASDILAPSTINIKDNDDFKLGLLEQFKLNSKYQGRYISERKKLLDSFAGMLVTNDNKFSKWIKEREHSRVYDNIAYTLFLALKDINKSFETAEGPGSKITIMDISTSPLMYKVELRLPSKYFKPAAVERAVNTFENYLKKEAADTEVQCLISTSSDIFTIRLLRLDYKGLISIGDIMRYRDDSGQTPYEKFINPKLGAPMLVGLRDNEYPHIVDLEKNTAMAIVGGSGSGKSWLTYELGVNLVSSNDYNEVQFIVLDAKNATFWKTFARMPHVLGYHTNVEDYVDIAREVENEMNRRQEMLGEYEMEDFVEARSTFKKDKDFETLKQFPLLVFIIDEITSTMNTLEGLDEKKETQKAFISAIENISQKGRSAGVRLLTIGQRAVNASLPKNVRANSSMLFGMKMNAESDFNILFDGSKQVEKMTKPLSAGLGIMTSEDINGYHNLKTLTPGGEDTSQIRTFLRIMALDWVRRAAGRDDLYMKPINTQYDLSYNRPKFLDASYTELSEGRILSKSTVSKGFEVDLLNEAIETKAVQRKNENTFTDAERTALVEKHTQKVVEPILDIEEEILEYKEPIIVEEPVLVEDFDKEDEEVITEVSKKPFQFPDLTDFINNLNITEDDEEDDEEEFSFENDDNYQDELFNAKKELFTKQNVEEHTIEETTIEETTVEEPIVEEPIVEEPIVEEPIGIEEAEDEDDVFGDIFKNSDEDEEPEIETIFVSKPLIKPKSEIKPKVILPETKVIDKPSIKAPIQKPIVKEPIKKEVVKKEPVYKSPVVKPEVKPKTVQPRKDTSGVTIQFNTPSAKKKVTPNMSIQQYIIENGVKLSSFESALPKDVLDNVYTQNQINKAIRAMEIMSTKDGYVASL